MSRAIIITSYLEHLVDLAALCRSGDHIVCLDGGLDLARAYGIRPHLLLGDLDSLKGELPEDPGFEVRRFPPEKDYSDLELAFRQLDPIEHPDLVVIGGIGGRLDHTICNVQLLSTYTGGSGFRRIEIMDGRNRCFVIKGNGDDAIPRPIPRQNGCYLSLFSLTEECRGLTITGVKYPLEDATLSRGVSLGVSNEFLPREEGASAREGSHAEISLREGTLLVVISSE